jgi:hypothetical protein
LFGQLNLGVFGENNVKTSIAGEKEDVDLNQVNM